MAGRVYRRPDEQVEEGKDEVEETLDAPARTHPSPVQINDRNKSHLEQLAARQTA